MTNHIKEAAAELDVAEHYTKYEMVAESHMESAKTHALIAIAQQLRIMNLINSGIGVTKVRTNDDGSISVAGRMPLTPDVAEALGIKEEQ